MIKKMAFLFHYSGLFIKCFPIFFPIRSINILRRKVKLPNQPSPFNPLIVGPLLNKNPNYREPRPVADFIYEEVENKDNIEDDKLKLILLKTVDELGVPGDIVFVDRNYGRFHLLSSKAAVYASSYNLNKYKEMIELGAKDRVGPSSAFVATTMKKLSNEVIIVVMNDINPWTINSEHIRIACRASGYLVPSECIKLPNTLITGPDIQDKQGKDFAVMITINNKETINVRCLLHHKGLPIRLNWNRKPRYILLDEQKDLLESMPAQEELEEDQYKLN